MPDMYKLGVSSALARLGLTQPEEESHLGRNIAMGAAAGLPFLGLIGQKKLLHDPLRTPEQFEGVRRYKTLRGLEHAVGPGDILVAGNPGWEGWKAVQSPTTGSHFYHADIAPSQGKYMPAGELYSTRPERMERRRGWSPREAFRRAGRLRDYPYEDVVVLRPRQALTPEQVKRLREIIKEQALRPYEASVGAQSVARDVFVPQTVGKANPGPVVCKGNVCSTMPARAYEELGMPLLSKPGQRVTAADLLRSELLEPVAYRTAPEARAAARTMRMMPYLTRGALGAGLAASVYGLSEDPALAAVPIGMAAAPALTRGAMDLAGMSPAVANALRLNTKSPYGWGTRVFEAAPSLLSGLKEPGVLKSFLTRTTPLALAGGLAAYLGAKGIRKAMQSE
jgi:hypothetical protein